MIDDSPVADYAAKASLAGGTAIVIGAGAGIGRQTVHALSQIGAHVICVDVDADRAEAVAAEVGGTALVADACEREGMQEIVAAGMRAERPLRTIIDIIGIAAFGDLDEHTDEMWARSERMNLRHAVYLIEYGGRALAELGGGTIVFVASISSLYATQHHGAYGAHKAALMSLVKTSSVELGPRGIRVNAVAPGVIWTDRMAAAIGDEQRDVFAANTPTGRLGLPSDIAGVNAFLATELSSHVNGQYVLVDGGVSVRFPYPVDLLV